MILVGLVFLIFLFSIFGVGVFLSKATPQYAVEPKQEDPVIQTEEDIDFIFKDFIGNKQAVETIKRLIKYSKINGIRKLPNIGLFGPRSTGKTELYRRIARAMGIPSLALSKSTINSEETFFKQVSKEIQGYSGGALVAPYMIIFIDEVHILSKRIQDSLLTALESDDRCFRTKFGDIDTSNITFIVATTDPGKLSPAFISRLTVLELKMYDQEEIMEIIYARMHNDKTIDECIRVIDRDTVKLIANASRLIPRKAIEILKQTSYAIAVDDIGCDYEDVLQDLKNTVGCDERGITEVDLKYLKFLKHNGSAGLMTLSSYLDTDKDNIENYIEPWLIRNGFITKGARGRSITSTGLRLLNDSNFN
jgi:Holliday junction DNA helicase RuvB